MRPSKFPTTFTTAPSPALTREALAAALHDRYGAGLCISAQDIHGWEECQAGSQWTDDADAILSVLGTPPPAIRCSSCKAELRYDPTDPVAHIGCLIREESETPAPTSTREENL